MADVLLHSGEAIGAHYQPDFQGAEAAAKGDLPVPEQ